MEAADSEITQQMMREAAHGAADVLRALANDDRLMLMCFLSQGEASVGQLEQALGIHQPTLSQQLAVMRRLKLVATRREGKQIFYRIDDPRILTLLNTLYALYCPKPAAEGADHDD
ncbi:ArsR/SmtB family transcription factor [Dickeya solani]|uniref:Metalloregulator ArsR/SmtB family transcription factor n=2 Tax=Dickeya solani TaxID=1089444 RepID=A0ABU4EEJ1_9GAMM|nr:metalloregulator ArsR/SmtB family transcription factor [Dickeya solani]AUC43132.1 Transcriptional regulator, ArsR family [Dickeya solani RNS 08.23.3.1.A]AYQ46080.1 Biofilm growth-associated repressor [Dickeya solani]AYQ50247.1 Biofilm growth-associated repressor [Dickeya solani]ERO59244.1 Transcriptional regulator, ArsR family [Dickeya solani D s0432-1]MBD3607163.1 transcriptional regulator [Dickeya solani]